MRTRRFACCLLLTAAWAVAPAQAAAPPALPCRSFHANILVPATGKVWLWTANGSPLRSVTDIRLYAPLADPVFMPPADVQFQNISGLLQNLGLDPIRRPLGGARS